jgi:hypothetical protein
VSKYLSSIWVQPETPLLWQEATHVYTDAPNVVQEVPDDLQETSDDPQEDVNNRQGDSQVCQVDRKMAEFSWRDLPFDKEANANLLDQLCRRGSEKDRRSQARRTFSKSCSSTWLPRATSSSTGSTRGFQSSAGWRARPTFRHVTSRRPVTSQATAPRRSRPRRRT